MSKKPKKKRRVGRAGAGARQMPPQAHAWRPKNVIAAAALTVCALLAASYAATRFDPVRRAVGLRPLITATAQQPTPLPLAKEYVYAGGRLVATEEPTPAATPTPTPAGPPPTNLTATASFPNSSPAVVSLAWGAPSSGSPASYVVERAETRDPVAGLQYSPVSPPAAGAPTPSNPYVDQTASVGKVYVYRVKAVYAAGPSNYSNQDIATTVRYTGDDPLVGANDPQGRPASKVAALNLTELQSVVNSVRSLAGLGAAAWNDPPPRFRDPILATHFIELRANLNPALAALGVSVMPDDATLGVGLRVKKEHVQDVREKVR